MALPSTILAMLLADARLPAGGHAHSAGLEPALRGGMPVESVPAYLHSRARTTSLVEAGTAVVARHVATAAPAELVVVERAWAARTPSDAMRAASRHLGRGYLRLAHRLWPGSPILGAVACLPAPSRAVVLGAIAAESRMDPLALARLVIYDETAAAAAALLKLEPGDPATVTAWVLQVCQAADPLLIDLAAIVDPAAIPAAGAPQAEEWAQAHALLTQRLFRA